MNLETLISIDGEYTGKIPGPYSMISLGAVAYDTNGNGLASFKINMEEIPGANRDTSTMNWWATQRTAWETATTDAVSAEVGMGRFAEWLHKIPGTPKLIGWSTVSTLCLSTGTTSASSKMILLLDMMESTLNHTQ